MKRKRISRAALRGWVAAWIIALVLLAEGTALFAPAWAQGVRQHMWSNVRVHLTRMHTVQASDCGKTLALGGTAFYSLTFRAANTYPARCVIVAINEDNSGPNWRGKRVVLPALTSRILWPGQAIVYASTGSQWEVVVEPGRWQPDSAVTFYVNADLGKDDNDCLAGGDGACLTPSKAAWLHYTVLDQRNSVGITTVKLQDATSHYQGNVLIGGAGVGYNQIFFTGNT